MEKSAQSVDKKGVVRAPLRKRVRNALKKKKIQEGSRPADTSSKRANRKRLMLALPLPFFLKRFDSKGVNGWGSVNDVKIQESE